MWMAYVMTFKTPFLIGGGVFVLSKKSDLVSGVN
jgi:hypothetical protein